MRTALVIIALIAAACSSPSRADSPKAQPAAATPAPVAGAERNLVCERVKLLNEKAECISERTADIHVARVTVDGDNGKQILACALAPNALSLVCGPLMLEAEAPKAEPVAAKPKKK